MVRSDLAAVLAWRNHPDVRAAMYTQHEIACDEHERWFDRASQSPGKHLLVFEDNHRAMGFVNFNEAGSGRVAHWGFYAAPGAPKGTGRQLGRAALDYAFGQLHLHKVCGEALAYNERSIRLHLWLGFREEGVLRDQHFDGERYHHVIRFGLLSHEWLPHS